MAQIQARKQANEAIREKAARELLKAQRKEGRSQECDMDQPLGKRQNALECEEMAGAHLAQRLAAGALSHWAKARML